MAYQNKLKQQSINKHDLIINIIEISAKEFSQLTTMNYDNVLKWIHGGYLLAEKRSGQYIITIKSLDYLIDLIRTKKIHLWQKTIVKLLAIRPNFI